jgi:hypothetical protein
MKIVRPIASDRSQDFDDRGLGRSIIVKPPDQDGPVDHLADTTRFLGNRIAGMMRRGERRRLLLSNLAIDEYRRRPIRLVQ